MTIDPRASTNARGNTTIAPTKKTQASDFSRVSSMQPATRMPPARTAATQCQPEPPGAANAQASPALEITKIEGDSVPTKLIRRRKSIQYNTSRNTIAGPWQQRAFRVNDLVRKPIRIQRTTDQAKAAR